MRFIYSVLYAVLLPALLFVFSVQVSHGGTGITPAATIEVVTVFDSPKTHSNIFPQDIDDFGRIVGIVSSLTNPLQSHGFLRLRNGRFAPAIIEPDADTYTATTGISNTGVICASMAFASIAGTIITIDIPGAGDFVFANDINNAGEIVGSYTTQIVGEMHGFFRDAAGNVTAPIDAPGATQTDLRGINDNSVIVGNALDALGQHGLVLQLPSDVTTFDYSGGSSTKFRGINKNGLITGYYIGSVDFIAHGTVAR